jgi:hypothetical protein
MGPAPISDMLVIVKSREIQRALLGEMSKDRAAAVRHFLAAAHLELVLAEDYRSAGDESMALRSRLSAASCFWRAGNREGAETLFQEILQAHPAEDTTIQALRAELAHDHPAQAS